MKRLLHPPIFTNDDLWAISQALTLCGDGVSRLVCLLQQIRSFRFGDVRGLPEAERRRLEMLATVLDCQTSLALWEFLLETGLVGEDNYLDLDGLSQRCLLKIAG